MLTEDDMAQIRAYAQKIAAKATPPDERRIRVLRKVFGPIYAQRAEEARAGVDHLEHDLAAEGAAAQTQREDHHA